MKYYFDGLFSALGAIASYLFGGLDGFMYALISFVILDYISGVLAAIVKRELSSSIGFNGIARKCMIFIVVGVAHVADRELLGGTALMRDAVVFFYLANEGLSILENAIKINTPIPDVVKEKLLMFHDKGNKGDEKSETGDDEKKC